MKIKKIFNQLKSISMTREEKSRIRVALISLTGAENVAKPMRAPRVSDYRRPARSTFGLTFHFKSIGAAVFILILASTGVTFAAEHTLPGDLLYPVKVNLTEEVRSAITISSSAKMDWEKERVVRRLEETEKLIETNQGTPQRLVQAEAAIKTQMEVFASAASETSASNPTAVMAATAELEPTLKVHQGVIAARASDDKSGNQNTNGVLSAVAEGIIKTSAQETVAIESASVKTIESLVKLTDEKISGVSVAIDASVEAESKLTNGTSPEPKTSDIKTEDSKPIDISNDIIETKPGETNTQPKSQPGEKTSTGITDDPKISDSKDSKTAPADVATLKSETSLMQNSEITVTPPVMSTKEALVVAKAKLEEAKTLREKGEYKAALTLAQEAYKDVVALKLQAKINKAKTRKDDPKVDPKTEIKSETKTEVKTDATNSTQPNSNPTGNTNPQNNNQSSSTSGSKTEVQTNQTGTSSGVSTGTSVEVKLPIPPIKR